MRKLLLTTLFIAVTSVGFSQAIISTLSISPTNPTDCENVSASVSLVLYCANYTYNGYTISTSGNNVQINLNYTAGLICLPALVYPTVNVNLGQLPSGSVTITAVAYLNSSVSSTSAPVNTTVSSCCGADAQFTLSQDTICLGDSVVATSNSTNADSIRWFKESVYFDTAVAPTINFDTAGYYEISLVAYSDTCNDTADKYVQVHELPNIDLGNDTTICDGESLLLNASNGQSHLWSDGSTNQTYLIDTTETVWVTVTANTGCVGSDTFSITDVLPYSTVDLGPDQTICPNDSTTLTPGAGFANYLWSNGTTNSSINVNAFGLYWVEANQINECTSRDTIFINHHIISPMQFVEDSNKCGSNTISTMIGYTSYSWSTGVITSSTTVTDTTMVSLTAVDNNGCSLTDSILAVVLEVPAVNLGNDTHVCPGDPLILSSNVAGTYQWSTGGIGSALAVTSAGQYWLQVTAENGCIGRDTIKVGVCVGINDVTNRLNVYPSPASDKITIQSSNELLEEVRIISLSGQIVNTITSYTQIVKVEVNDLAGGLYFVEITTASGMQRIPIVVAK